MTSDGGGAWRRSRLSQWWSWSSCASNAVLEKFTVDKVIVQAKTLPAG